MLQNTINYPNTMKKKSSKANMLEGNGQPISGSNQYASTSLSRTAQGQKLQQNFNGPIKGGRPLMTEDF